MAGAMRQEKIRINSARRLSEDGKICRKLSENSTVRPSGFFPAFLKRSVTISSNLKEKRMNKSFMLSVKVLLRDPEGKYLIVQRSRSSKNNPGKWDFPGGKVD